MKFPLILTFLFSFSYLQANDLNVQVNAGYCSSSQSGQAIVLVTGGTEPYTFEWNDSSLEGDEVYDLGPGTYGVLVRDANNCEVIEFFEISLITSIDYDLHKIDVTCFGGTDGFISFDNFSPSDLLFSIDGVNFSNDPVFENLAAGTYEIFVLESNNCITPYEFFIDEPAPLQVDLGSDKTMNFGNRVELIPIISSPSFFLDYNWTPTGESDCNDCLNIWVAPFETTTYFFTVQDGNGCTASDTITVNIRDNPGIYVPNAFTPNRDGTNDIFTVYGGVDNVQRFKKFIIRDNFGNIVHETNEFPPSLFNISNGWDGTYKGKAMNEGVFMYQVTVLYKDDTEEDFFGTVTLLR